jgi:GT2 family glycosyltransferase
MTSNKPIDLSIIIVNWNSWSYLFRCINSIVDNAEDIKCEIIVVDNCSNDQSVQNIRANFPGVILVENNKNKGYPRASNQAFNLAQGKYFLSLNPDTVIKPKVLQRSIQVLNDDKSIACVGVKTIKRNGKVVLSCARSFPGLWGSFWSLFDLDKIFTKFKLLNTTDMTYWDHNDNRDVDMLSGAYMMFPCEVYRMYGGFDTKIPMFYEDIEFCARLKKNGKRIYYIADVEIVHYVGSSTAKAEQSWITKLRYEAIYLYFFEYGGGRYAAFLYSLIVLVAFPLRFLLSPFICIAYKIKGHKVTIMTLISNIITSAVWSYRKVICFIK